MPPLLKLILVGAAGLLALYVVLLALLFALQRKLLYHPSRAPGHQLEPEAASVGFVPWRSDDRFHGWQTTNRNAQASLLMFHGNAGHAVYMASFLPGLREAASGRVQVFAMEYPGYGARPGEASEATLIEAAREALAALPADRPVYVLGQSLGCAVASALWAEHPERIKGAILVVPFNNLPDVALHHFPIFPMRLLIKDRYPSDSRLSHDLGPLYVALAENDEVIPVVFGQKLHDGYPGPKRLQVVPGAGHNDLNKPEAAWWREALGFVAPKMLADNP